MTTLTARLSANKAQQPIVMYSPAQQAQSFRSWSTNVLQSLSNAQFNAVRRVAVHSIDTIAYAITSGQITLGQAETQFTALLGN